MSTVPLANVTLDKSILAFSSSKKERWGIKDIMSENFN